MTREAWLPTDFAAPVPPDHSEFRFAPLGPEHNAADLAAWTSSIDHIHATPGFPASGWPQRPYTLAENLADLTEHRDHHQRAVDFAWTVLDAVDPGVVIGCVYLKRDPTNAAGGEACSWVRVDRAALDLELRAHLRPWFAEAWPLDVRYVS